MEAAETQQRTHCSVCGSKIVRQDLTYCIYCGNNFAMMSGEADKEKKRKETRNMARLTKMPEHEGFSAAIERDLGEGQEFDKWRRGLRSGLLLVASGGIFIALSLSAGLPMPIAIMGVLLLGAGAARAAKMRGKQAKRLKLPLMKRPCVVTDRRSETEMLFNTGITTYFFTLEFGDGNEAEFRYPGRGAHTDPLSKGVSGIAHTRGVELIGFEQVRV